MTSQIIIVLFIAFVVLCAALINYYDKKLVKQIHDYEKRLEEKGILKRHFSKPLS